jgi:hypothetical protein
MSISQDDAIAAARREAEQRGWRWEEPVYVSRRRAFIFFGRLTYEIRTNADKLGCNARFVIDGENASIREAYWLPR